MYRSDIAENLKIKIDNEMKKLVNNTNLLTMKEHITSVKNKEELKSIKSKLLYEEYNLSQPQVLEKAKGSVRMREAGYANAFVLSLIVIFVLGIAIGIGYMLFRLGV